MQAKYPEYGYSAGEYDLIPWPVYTDARNTRGEPANNTSGRSPLYANELGVPFIPPYQLLGTEPPFRHNSAATQSLITHNMTASAFFNYDQPIGLLDFVQEGVMSIPHSQYPSFSVGRTMRSPLHDADLLGELDVLRSSQLPHNRETSWRPGDAHLQQVRVGSSAHSLQR